MPSRTIKRRPAGRSQALALSLVVHGLALAALSWFAPVAHPRARDSEPVTIRLVQRPLAPVELPAAQPALDRRRLPEEPAAPVIQPQLTSADELFAELPEETLAFPTEVPASVRRSAIGVGAAGALRVPRAHSPSSAVASPEAAPATQASACKPVAESTAPVPLDCPAPEYPAGSATVSEQGRVRLEIRIDCTGRVESARILHSSGHARLDEAAEAAVRRWRFRAARQDGVAVPWRLEHTIVFRVSAAAG